MSIRIDLIDRLLSPTEHPSAETEYKSLLLLDRVNGLLSLILTLPCNDHHDVGRVMLSCVLLRREVIELTNVEKSAQTVALFKGMTDQLIVAFLQKRDGNGGVSRQIGFVVAEICSSLTILDDRVSVDVTSNVLSKIEETCISGEELSLGLLSILAQRSPISIWKVNSTGLIESLFQRAMYELKTASRIKMTTIQYFLEVVCHVGIAINTTQKHSIGTGNTANRNESLLKTIQVQTAIECNEPKKLTVESNSFAAGLGRVCIPILLQAIVGCVHEAYSSNEMVIVQKCMEQLSHCASTTPSILAADLQLLTSVVEGLLFVAQGKGDTIIEDSTRLSALEVLASLTEVPGVQNFFIEEPNLWKLCFTSVVTICANLIARGVDDDVDGWSSESAVLQDDVTFWDNDDTATFAETILVSFLNNIGGGTNCLPIILPIVETMISCDTWQKQRAALSMLEICLSALPCSFSIHVPVALEAALRFASHPCERVQFQAVQLLGAICQSDVANVRDQHAHRILQSLIHLLASKCTKIICHSCLAIVSFCRGKNGDENMSQSSVLPFLNDVLNALAAGPLSLDIAANQVVYIRVFGVIACLANVVGPGFAPFYDNVVPGLLEAIIYGLEHDKVGNVLPIGTLVYEVVALRGAAIEAATIIGLAIRNEEKFLPDAEKMTTLILTLIESQGRSDSCLGVLIPQEQLLAASARIASVMGPRYAPFIPKILPHLLNIVREETEISVMSCDESSFEATERGIEYNEDTGAESITVSLPGIGSKKVVLNTSQILEKAFAARAVYEHANSMGASFGPYAEECIKAFLPLINFKYSAEVRSTASQALIPLFDSICKFCLSEDVTRHGISPPMQLFAPIIIPIARQLQDEEGDDIETLTVYSDAISSVCYSAFVHKNEADGNQVATLNLDEANCFIKDLINAASSCLQRRAAIINLVGLNADRVDEDQRAEYKETLSSEAEFLSDIVDSIGYTVKSLKEDFVPIFAKLVNPAFGPVLMTSNDDRARLAAICLFDDCVEHCGRAAASHYAPTLAHGVMQVINDTNDGDVELKEASVYGVAQIARHAPKQTLCSSACHLLQRLIEIAKEGQMKAKDSIENLRLVENSSSAVATLCLFKESPFHSVPGFDRKEVLDVFLSNLPLLEDEDEAKFCHEGFCELAEGGQVDLSSNVQHLVNIIGQISAAVVNGDDIASMETCKRLSHILTFMQQANGAVIQQAYSGLSQEAQHGITSLMTN